MQPHQYGNQPYIQNRGGYGGGNYQQGGYPPQQQQYAPMYNGGGGYYQPYNNAPFVQPAYTGYNGQAPQQIPSYGRGGRGMPYSRVMPFAGAMGRGGRGAFGMRARRKKPFVGGSLETQRQWERQTVCCFFLQGDCKFSEGCRFLHESSETRPCQFGVLCRVGHADRVQEEDGEQAKANTQPKTAEKETKGNTSPKPDAEKPATEEKEAKSDATAAKEEKTTA